MKPFSIFIALLLSRPAMLQAADAPKPNIVLILTDDLGSGHVGWQNPKVKTPNLDHLAHAGVILKRHYVAPVCSPTRAALMTGRYWSRFNCNDPYDGPQVLPAGTETVASSLKSVG